MRRSAMLNHSAIFVISWMVFFGRIDAARADTSSGTLWIHQGQVLTIGPGVERRHEGAIIVSGDGRIEVEGGRLVLKGSMVIKDRGSVTFTGGELHHEGNDTHVLVADDALLAFRGGGRYHFVQTYVAQHVLRATQRGRIELAGTRINCDGATITIQLFDQASYTATATRSDPGSWSTWYLRDESRLVLDGVVNGGDVVFYDAVAIDVRNTVGIMPWLYFPAGSDADLTFPPASQCDAITCPVVSKRIDGTTVRGIAWSVNIQSSAVVAWGIHSYPDSTVTVRDSALAMALVRLAGSNSYEIDGEFRNGSHYADKRFAQLHDRTLRLVNTSVNWWKVDVIDGAEARIDNITFSEMMVMGSGRAIVTDSICEGQTIHLGATNDASVHFEHGEVWTHVSAWDDALMVLDDSLVDWTKGQYQYQSRNIAHNRARLYALNSELRSLPEAMDAALVVFTRLGGFREVLTTDRATRTRIAGSAWIAAGADSRVSFDRWTLAIRAPGATTWRSLASGTTQVRNGPLAWLPAQLISRPGDYQLRLTVDVKGDHPASSQSTREYPAIKTLVVR